MSWDSFKDRAKESGGGANYVKLKNGESIKGVFRGEPYVYYQKFKEKEEYSTYHPGTSMKFRLNFIVKEDAGYVAKVLNGGSRLANAIVEAREEYGLDCVYKIKRSGEGKETEYSLLFQEKLPPKSIEVINQVKLNDLGSGRKVKSENEPPPHDDSDMPHDQAEIDEEVPF